MFHGTVTCINQIYLAVKITQRVWGSKKAVLWILWWRAQSDLLVKLIPVLFYSLCNPLQLWDTSNTEMHTSTHIKYKSKCCVFRQYISGKTSCSNVVGITAKICKIILWNTMGTKISHSNLEMYTETTAGTLRELMIPVAAGEQWLSVWAVV